MDQFRDNQETSMSLLRDEQRKLRSEVQLQSAIPKVAQIPTTEQPEVSVVLNGEKTAPKQNLVMGLTQVLGAFNLEKGV